ncbi:glycosyltransferase [Nocardia sp. NPDC088792]|uniref:glycosyltransferase n=1 Tax=Nocardia sp. NPDC088792 TaxID=3364332 RepID=UPI003822BC57
MRVLLAFAGSRGDAQPGILLARELAGRGHRVTLAVSPNLVEFAEHHGIPAAPFGVDSEVLLRAQLDDTRFAGLNPYLRVRALLDLQRRGVPEAGRDLLDIATDAQVLVTGMACEELAAEVAAQRGVPLAAMHFFPIAPSRAVPVVPAAWGHRIPGPLNRLAWRALAWVRARALEPALAELRAEAPVPHREPGKRVRIQAYDGELFPGLELELGGAPVTGFPVVPEDSASAGSPAASGALEAWLSAGPAPVYVGFGSMQIPDPEGLERTIRAVCRHLSMRLLLSGSMFRQGFSPEVAVVRYVDHTSVLPRCAAAVHHGGAGTTAAALRAGVPSVICAVQADQPYWGRQLETLGLGATLPFTDLTADRLEQALISATESSTVLRAAAYGMRFRDDGVSRAADVVESMVPVADRPDHSGTATGPTLFGGSPQ